MMALPIVEIGRVAGGVGSIEGMHRKEEPEVI
jgi:hypothetical protein